MKISLLLAWIVTVPVLGHVSLANAAPAVSPGQTPASVTLAAGDGHITTQLNGNLSADMSQNPAGDPTATIPQSNAPNLPVVNSTPVALDPPRPDPEPANPPEPAPSNVTPLTIPWSVNVEQYFNAWSNNLGSNGFQSVTPITLTYKQDDWDFGIRTAYIVSGQDVAVVQSGQKIGSIRGSVSTLSDTSLSAAYNLREGDLPLRFNLDLNLPTGRATLTGNEKLALMDSSLVFQTRFGEGFNIAPGVSVSRALGERDVVGLGFSYIIRGQFDPNGDLGGDEIKPGNDLVGTLQYQHVDTNWMLLGGAIYTNSGVTQRAGANYYQKGDRLDLNLTGIYLPFDRNRVQLAARYYTQGPDGVVTATGNLQSEAANTNSNALYLGLDWSLALDDRQQSSLHFLADWLGVEANSYDRVNNLFNGGRSKFSVGLGYDFASSPTSRWGVQARYFTLVDRANPVTQQDVVYNGLSIFANVNFNF
jgi:hypothetical protein